MLGSLPTCGRRRGRTWSGSSARLGHPVGPVRDRSPPPRGTSEFSSKLSTGLPRRTGCSARGERPEHGSTSPSRSVNRIRVLLRSRRGSNLAWPWARAVAAWGRPSCRARWCASGQFHRMSSGQLAHGGLDLCLGQPGRLPPGARGARASSSSSSLRCATRPGVILIEVAVGRFPRRAGYAWRSRSRKRSSSTPAQRGARGGRRSSSASGRRGLRGAARGRDRRDAERVVDAFTRACTPQPCTSLHSASEGPSVAGSKFSGCIWAK